MATHNFSPRTNDDNTNIVTLLPLLLLILLLTLALCTLLTIHLLSRRHLHHAHKALQDMEAAHNQVGSDGLPNFPCCRTLRALNIEQGHHLALLEAQVEEMVEEHKQIEVDRAVERAGVGGGYAGYFGEVSVSVAAEEHGSRQAA